MYKKWIAFHLSVGFLSFLLTFFLSLEANIWTTSLLRAFYVFAGMMGLTALIQFIFSIAMPKQEQEEQTNEEPMKEQIENENEGQGKQEPTNAEDHDNGGFEALSKGDFPNLSEQDIETTSKVVKQFINEGEE